MRKGILILLGFLVLILLLGVLTVQKINDWQEKIGRSKQVLNLGEFPLQQTQSQKFIDTEGKFKIEYPGGWLSIQDEKTLEAMTSQEWKEKYDLKTLLVAQKFLESDFAQLIVAKGKFNMGVGEIIERMKATNQEKGWQMEIIKSEIQENEAGFEAKYQTSAGDAFRSQDKILKNRNNEVYLVTCFVLEKDWPKLAEGIKSVVNSAQLLTEP